MASVVRITAPTTPIRATAIHLGARRDPKPRWSRMPDPCCTTAPYLVVHLVLAARQSLVEQSTSTWSILNSQSTRRQPPRNSSVRNGWKADIRALLVACTKTAAQWPPSSCSARTKIFYAETFLRRRIATAPARPAPKSESVRGSGTPVKLPPGESVPARTKPEGSPQAGQPPIGSLSSYAKSVKEPSPYRLAASNVTDVKQL